jgi:hypothetical protein
LDTKIPRPVEPGLPISCIKCGNATLDYFRGLCTKCEKNTFTYLMWKNANKYPMTEAQKQIIGGVPE